ncbi:MAG: hypothetical protein RQ739_04120 [Desulfotignum sp.]|nr:hypothetical protein [Desulfotignum sp.]
MTSSRFIPVTPGKDPHQDAWLTAFFLENHIDPFAYPNKVATVEQIEFMVYLENGEQYFPCSDEMFTAIMSRNSRDYLLNRYQTIYDKTIRMVDEFIESTYDQKFLTALIQIKYDHEVESLLMIPSRLEKRLCKIFVSQTHIENPYALKKQEENSRAQELLSSSSFISALNHVDGAIQNLAQFSLSSLRTKIKEIELQRLLSMMCASHLWEKPPETSPSVDTFHHLFETKVSGNGLPNLMELIHTQKRKILWLTDESGGVMVDVAIAKFLADLGHLVVMAVKEAPVFKKVSITDTRNDPVLVKALEGSHFIFEKTISKNRLVQLLKQDENIYVVSDGTRENLNLLLSSTTFARIFKEVDVVVSRGPDQKRRLIQTHFQFTRDIINLTVEDHEGAPELSIVYKPRHPDCVYFSHRDLEERANRIIDQMKAAKAKNMTVMFYSGIIASIPGKIDVAKKIMDRFIDYLKKQYPDLFIINPSRYYEPGMDADDLMYMWEIVQTSNLIDVWRFQTAEDIAKGFALMNLKVPPEWIGKDATYSTGCTKEMRIAQEVLKTNPEMQIIGPSLDKFMRRNEYGVGSMYDQRLADA